MLETKGVLQVGTLACPFYLHQPLRSSQAYLPGAVFFPLSPFLLNILLFYKLKCLELVSSMQFPVSNMVERSWC